MPNDHWLTSPSWDQSVAAAWDRKRAEVSMMRQRITPDLAQEIAQLAGQWGDQLSPGMAQAIGQYRTQIPFDQRPTLEEDPAFIAAMQAETDANLDKGWGEALMSGVRGSVRGALATMEGMFDAVVGMPTRTLVRAAEDDVSFGQAVQDVSSRPGAGMEFIADAATGNWGDIDLGEGWLPGGRDYAQQRAERGDISQGELEMFLDPARAEYDPEYHDELLRMKAQAPTYQGQPLSLGRFAAVQVLEPGTKPYHLMSGLIDGATQMFADPASKALRTAGVARQASRTFSKIENPWGLINNSHRLAVDGEKIRGFLDSGSGVKLKEYLAGTSSHNDVWQLLSSKGKHTTVSRQLVNEITETSDPSVIDNILSRELGATIRERPNLSKHTALSTRRPGFIRSPRDIRLTADMPGTHITLQNLDQGVADFRNYLINAKVAPEKTDELMTEFMHVESFDQLEATMLKSARVIDATITQAGGKNLNMHERYVTGFEGIRSHLKDSLSREMTDGGVTDSIQLGDETVGLLDDITLLSEYTDVAIPLLETSQIRSAASKTQKLIDHGGLAGDALELAIKGAEWGMSVWKPLQLIRPAWTMRVLGEQQMRFAALGVNNQVSNPISTIAIAVGLKDEQLTRTITGDPFEVLAEYRAALTRGSGGWLDTPDVRFKHGDLITYRKNGDGTVSREMANVWLDELATIIDDNTGRQVARAMSDPAYTVTVGGKAARELDDTEWATKLLREQEFEVPFDQWELEDLIRDDPAAALARLADGTSPRPMTTPSSPTTLTGVDAVKHWFWEGDGVQYRKRLATDKGRAAAREANQRGEIIDPATQILTSRQAADRYIDNVIARVNHFTKGDASALSDLANGRIGGAAYVPMTKNKKAVRWLEQHPELAPDTLLGPNLYTRDPKAGEVFKDATNAAFEMLMTKPDNRLFRSPMFRQRYWERVAELAPKMDAKDIKKIVDQAGEANVPEEILKRIKPGGKFVVPAGKTGTNAATTRLALDEVDTIARAYGLDEVRSTLYDLSRRSQFAESLRLVAPFAEAWREVLTTWTRIAAKNPQTIRRVQQGYQGARDGWGWISGNEGGFFFENDFGDEVFAYPGGGIIGKLIGVDEGIDMEANVSGLNLVASSVLPGVGPIVQWSVANSDRDGIADEILDRLVPPGFLGEGTSGSDFIRKQINPFGEDELSFDNALEQVLPSWFKTLFNATGKVDQVAFENTVAQIMKANVASGRVPADKVDENYEISRDAANKLYVVRGLANSSLPTGFRPKVKVADIHGEVFQIEVLANQYREMVDKYEGSGHDPQEAATAEFIQLYGLDPALISQAKTRQVTPRETRDQGGVEWERANYGLQPEYDAIFGYLSPLSGEPQDWQATKDALEDGDIVTLDARQQLLLANNTIGYAQYFAAQEQLEPLDLEQKTKDEVLALYRAELRSQYEGFDTFIPGVPENPDLDVQVEQARKALDDPRIDNEPLKSALSQYLEGRDLVETILQQNYGVGLTATKTAAAHREVLAAWGQQLANDTPEFKTLWDRVLIREVT